jgi:hypothetical protein
MVNPTTFVAVTPSLSGATVTYTACSASTTGDLVPIGVGSGMTVVHCKNADAGSSHTFTFTSQPDEWGVVTTHVITVLASTTQVVQLSPPARWANPSAGNTCAVTYDSNTNLSILVENVPWQSV